jgi:hypothetical protein
MENLPAILLPIGFVIVAVVAVMWHYSRGSSLLEQWASRHGYRIVRREYRNFFKGPFFWTSSKDQVVYYVTVEDEQGRIRNGWVRCGGYFFGLLSDNVEVQWDA